MTEEPAGRFPIANIKEPANFTQAFLSRAAHFFHHVLFSSLLRRIVIVNLAALVFLVAEIMLLNQFREGLVEAKLESLYTQGQIIAGAISASNFMEDKSYSFGSNLAPTNEIEAEWLRKNMYNSDFAFQLNPERVTAILRHIISPKDVFVRVFDLQGSLRLDSRFLYVRGQKLPDISLIHQETQKPSHSFGDRIYDFIFDIFMPFRHCDYVYPRVFDFSPLPDKILHNIKLTHNPQAIRYCSRGGDVDFGVALPLESKGKLAGVALIATIGADIENTVFRERLAIFRTALVVAVVLIFLSTFLSYTIASPLRRLSEAADNASKRLNKRFILPDFSRRADEIGLLSVSFRGLTEAFYQRLEAIECFAADVSHELKNPLTSLRSAIDTLPLVQTEKQKETLYEIMKHDIRRLDRLITEISAASRVDSEVAREMPSIVDFEKLLQSYEIIFSQNSKAKAENLTIELIIDAPQNKGHYKVIGNDLRFGQVLSNILDNAQSFVPKGRGKIVMHLYRRSEKLYITITDNGPGIRVDEIEKVFQRFYTDRTEIEAFGQNSGLGLSISRQIIGNYGGRLSAENVYDESSGKVLGARFTIELPIAKIDKEGNPITL